MLGRQIGICEVKVWVAEASKEMLAKVSPLHSVFEHAPQSYMLSPTVA